MRKIICLIAAFVFLFPISLLAATVTGEVVKVTDGDTIQVLVTKNAVFKIRLAGIDCPEKGQSFGTKAKQMTAALAAGKTVRVEYDEMDRYGRILGIVFLPDGRNLNRELVRAGFAWQYRKYSQEVSVASLEQQARLERRGLWADPNPIPPWQWRKDKRIKAGR